MGVLDTLIAPKRTPRSRKPAPMPLPSGPLDALLSGQFAALGYAAGAVPHGGATGSAWSRG
ncbi:hypothetical protein, partial [Salmonella enterica]|uniref:hypothetical protein n=3 Tax=cellular organisms TaxID=131567 RepID=UPI0020C2C739